jgi:hypothetical protein
MDFIVDTIKELTILQKISPICSRWNEARMLPVKVKMAFPVVFIFLNPNSSGVKFCLLASFDLIY